MAHTTGAQGWNPTGPAAGSLPAHRSVALPDPVQVPGQSELVRQLDLQVGQRLQATVLQLLGNDQVLLGMLGSPVRATSQVPLQVGKVYDVSIRQVEPSIVLSRVAAVAQSALSSSPQTVMPGADPAPIAAPAALALLGGAALSEGVGVVADFLRKIGSGALQAGDLQQLHRALGHDQEARTLRLSSRPGAANSAEAAALGETLKAQLLQRLAALPESGPEASALRAALERLSQVEVDNARRADSGAPLWLPLPVPADGELQEARMFLLADEDVDSSHRPSGAGGVTIVLLLELSRLGAVRVDVHVRDANVSVSFRATKASTVQQLSLSKQELEEGMQSRDLRVAQIRVRPTAEGGAVPVADLLPPPDPSRRDPNRAVDLHA